MRQASKFARTSVNLEPGAAHKSNVSWPELRLPVDSDVKV